MTTPALVRGIGRWDLVAFLVNCTSGAGIFRLPSVGEIRDPGRNLPFAMLSGLAAVTVVYVLIRHRRGGGLLLPATYRVALRARRPSGGTP